MKQNLSRKILPLHFVGNKLSDSNKAEPTGLESGVFR